MAVWNAWGVAGLITQVLLGVLCVMLIVLGEGYE